MTLRVEVLDFELEQEKLDILFKILIGEGKKIVFVVDDVSDEFLVIGQCNDKNLIEAQRIASNIDRLGK
jgi:hypothetical protein